MTAIRERMDTYKGKPKRGNKMAKLINIEFTKTYATETNALRAVEKVIGLESDGLTFSIFPVEFEGRIRYGVLFYGERAVQAGVHYHFNVAG